MNNLINNYNTAYKELLKHVGLEEDWVVCPIDDKTDMFWYVSENSGYVLYGDKDDVTQQTGEHYEDEIYTQRFYKKHVYRGDDLTLIFCNPGVDGMKWWRIFDNNKEIKSLHE